MDTTVTAPPVDLGTTVSSLAAPTTNTDNLYSSSVAASARTSFTRVGPDTTTQSHDEEEEEPENDPQQQQQPRLEAETYSVTADPEPEAPAAAAIPQTPQIHLTFLLVSGRRRTMAFEPHTTVGRVKELVWSGWSSSEWQDESERPPAPSYLRVLHLGRILLDDETLDNLNFPTYTPSPLSSPASTTPSPPTTIVHLSIRSYVPPEDDDLKKKKKKVKWRRTESGAAGDEAEGEDAHGEGSGCGCCSGCVIC